MRRRFNALTPPEAGLPTFYTGEYMSKFAARGQEDWQPIKTAPKDHDVLIGWFRPAGHGLLSSEWYTRCAWWDKTEKAWTDNAVDSWGYEEVQHYRPTHWMPLPEPPHK